MSHNIETGTIAGQDVASFFSARQTAWHALGTVTEDAQDAESALRIAHLDWEVTKEPIFAETTFGKVQVDDQFATVRVSPYTGLPEALGVVGSKYTVVQNWANAEFLNALVDESGAHFETAGSLNGGRQVFITMKMPQHMLIGGVDPVDLYLVATNTHDASASFEVMATPVRVVCANTLRMATASATNRLRRRHTSGVTGAVQDAREHLGLTFKYAGAFQDEAERLLDQSMTDAEFRRMTENLFQVEEDASPRTKTVQEARLADLDFLFREAPTQAAIRNTRWAAYNAVAEYVDWAWPVQGDQNARYERIALTKPHDRIEGTKARALDLLSVR